MREKQGGIMDAAMVSVASFFPKDAFWGGITAACLPAICKRYSCALNTSSHLGYCELKSLFYDMV